MGGARAEREVRAQRAGWANADGAGKSGRAASAQDAGLRRAPANVRRMLRAGLFLMRTIFRLHSLSSTIQNQWLALAGAAGPLCLQLFASLLPLASPCRLSRPARSAGSFVRLRCPLGSPSGGRVSDGAATLCGAQPGPGAGGSAGRDCRGARRAAEGGESAARSVCHRHRSPLNTCCCPAACRLRSWRKSCGSLWRRSQTGATTSWAATQARAAESSTCTER